MCSPPETCAQHYYGTSSRCRKCPAGSTTVAGGKSVITDCRCEAGKYLVANLAVPFGGLGYCQACPARSTTDGVGKLFLTDCVCQAGTFLVANLAARQANLSWPIWPFAPLVGYCQACPAGSYSPAGSTRPAGTCPPDAVVLDARLLVFWLRSSAVCCRRLTCMQTVSLLYDARLLPSAGGRPARPVSEWHDQPTGQHRPVALSVRSRHLQVQHNVHRLSVGDMVVCTRTECFKQQQHRRVHTGGMDFSRRP